MSNGEVCCILGICCPPTVQEAALSKWLVSHKVCGKGYAPRLAKKLAPVLKSLAKKAKV